MAKLPQSVDTIKQLFQEAGITEYEPQLLLQMCDVAYSLTKQILIEAHSLAQYSEKKQMDKSDVEFALKAFNEKYWKDRPPKSLLAEIAAEKNSQPLPQIRQNFGLRLPNDRFCQLQPNYEHLNANEEQQSSTSNNAEIRQRTQQNQQRKPPSVANVHNFNPEIVSNLLMGRSDRKRPFPGDDEEKPADEEEDDYD